jgi:hypothetical protein
MITSTVTDTRGLEADSANKTNPNMELFLNYALTNLIEQKISDLQYTTRKLPAEPPIQNRAV